MNFFTCSLTLLLAASATANPFAPKVTKNTAKRNYVGRLLKGAKATANSQIRKLDEQDEQEVDITGYSLKFEKCQFVKQYDDEAAEDEDMGTVLATKRFIIFRLCPNGACSTCNYGFGEYIVDMDTYLESTVEYMQEQQEDYCQACDECGQDEEEEEEEEEGDEDEDRRRKLSRRRKLAVDCDTCYDECQNIENMEENGYLDASEYTECQNIYEDEDTGVVYYAGAMCASSGTKIKIGLFTDEYCSVQDESGLNIESLLQDDNDDGVTMQLSYHLLKKVVAEDECVADCLQVDENEDENDDGEEKEAETAEVCQQLYEAAGKCESSNGFDNGIDYSNYNGEDGWSYANQMAQEELVCDFMSSLVAGTYDQSGEIVVAGGRSTESGGVKVTSGQKVSLSLFILGTAGLAGYAVMLHSQLTQGAKADLSNQGGAMA